MSEVKKSKRANRFKIKCSECNTIMDSDHRNKHNKHFHLNLLKKIKRVRWEVLNASKNPFIISSRSQSVLRSSFGKTFGFEEPQTDLHVATYSAIDAESISHEASNHTKDEIDIEPPTKIKRKSNLNHHTDKIPHEIKNDSQLIDEHFLEEPASTDVNLADPTESCHKVHGMLNDLLQTLHNG